MFVVLIKLVVLQHNRDASRSVSGGNHKRPESVPVVRPFVGEVRTGRSRLRAPINRDRRWRGRVQNHGEAHGSRSLRGTSVPDPNLGRDHDVLSSFVVVVEVECRSGGRQLDTHWRRNDRDGFRTLAVGIVQGREYEAG